MRRFRQKDDIKPGLSGKQAGIEEVAEMKRDLFADRGDHLDPPRDRPEVLRGGRRLATPKSIHPINPGPGLGDASLGSHRRHRPETGSCLSPASRRLIAIE